MFFVLCKYDLEDEQADVTKFETREDVMDFINDFASVGQTLYDVEIHVSNECLTLNEFKKIKCF